MQSKAITSEQKEGINMNENKKQQDYDMSQKLKEEELKLINEKINLVTSQICQILAKIETLDFKTNELESGFNQKLDIIKFQEKIHSAYVEQQNQQLMHLKAKISEMVKDALPDIIQTDKQFTQVQTLHKNIADISQQIEGVLEIERRVNRVVKQLDSNQLVKMIQSVSINLTENERNRREEAVLAD